MEYLQQAFSVRFEYKVVFTEKMFEADNPILRNFLEEQASGISKKIFFVIDKAVNASHKSLHSDIHQYFHQIPSITLVPDILVIPGGEQSKNSERYFYQIVDAVNKYGIDRHSYIAAVGGGAVLDLAGYAAGVSHRGIRHIRIPTTVLSQNDSGVGVKNGINFFNKKNFLGTFAPPTAVFNDFHFLTTLSDEEWRSGTSEAVKVALIKDAAFFQWLIMHASDIVNRNTDAMKHLIHRCAQLHLEHIAGGDPFEMGSSRPLDFGHWSAHKIEQLSHFTIRHGEAVAMGIALDTAYSFISGRISEADANNVVNLLRALGFNIHHPLLKITDEHSPVLVGLNEFREHLGGKLTIMLLEAIGKGIEVHELNIQQLKRAGEWLDQVTN